MKRKNRRLDELMEEFAHHVLEHARSMAQSDHGKTNYHADQYIACFDALVARYGDTGRAALSRLLQHEELRVRMMAACFLLRYSRGEAVSVLEEISRRSDFWGFEASVCLMNWRDGTWDLDPESSS